MRTPTHANGLMFIRRIVFSLSKNITLNAQCSIDAHEKEQRCDSHSAIPVVMPGMEWDGDDVTDT